jgi:hypothetical protein
MSPKRKTIVPIISEDEEVKYVIYCRKSTDESSNKQVASIPRQIVECLKFAKREELEIQLKPKDFSNFESSEDIYKEDHVEDLIDRKVYQDSRRLFIVKEQESAKIPFNRKKWTKLTRLVEQGKIRGLISYSPDRQARNMLEGGTLIDFVDQGILKLQYANFHFDPNASGKMMLGIWFVFSKQYSDKLSEDVSAGNKRSSEKGETVGSVKHGYARGEDGKWIPDGYNFQILKEGFRLKIDENWSDSKIADYMNKRGYCRIGKKGQESRMTHQKANPIWTDPFYYGQWIYGNNIVDLLEKDLGFEPIITYEEHEILSERQKSFSQRHKREINKKDDLEEIRVIKNGFLVDSKGFDFSLTLPNKSNRHFPNLEKLKKTNPKATLANVVSSSQIRLYNNKTKQSVPFDKLDAKIREKIGQIRVTREQYLAYLGYARIKLRETFTENEEMRKRYQLKINQISNKEEQFIDKNLGKERNKDEEAVYQKKLKKFKADIKFYEKEIKDLESKNAIAILSTETMVKFMKNAQSFYDKATYVQKAEIIESLFLNMVYHHEKWLEIKVKDGLEELFSLSGGRGRN